jgi:uncharacterized membrane protein
MTKHPLVALLALLSFLGIADSWYLAQSALTGSPLACNINGLSGCNVVEQSVYSHLFGIPLGVYGVVFYGLMFVISILLLVLSSRFAHLLLVIFGAIGIIASAIFMYIQIFIIKALCVYCLTSAVIALIVFVLSFWLWKSFAPPPVVTVPGL